MGELGTTFLLGYGLIWCLGFAGLLLLGLAIGGVEVAKRLRDGDRLTLACTISVAILAVPWAALLVWRAY